MLESSVIVAIISAIIAAGSLIFAIYTHFATRKAPRLVYEVSQIADYQIPRDFLKAMNDALVIITIENVGNKSAKNIILELKTESSIKEYQIYPPSFNFIVNRNGTDANLTVSELNPSQDVRIVLICGGLATDNQIEQIRLSHAEGEGINKKSKAFSKVRFSTLFAEIELDTKTSILKIIRVGPFSL